MSTALLDHAPEADEPAATEATVSPEVAALLARMDELAAAHAAADAEAREAATVAESAREARAAMARTITLMGGKSKALDAADATLRDAELAASRLHERVAILAAERDAIAREIEQARERDRLAHLRAAADGRTHAAERIDAALDSLTAAVRAFLAADTAVRDCSPVLARFMRDHRSTLEHQIRSALWLGGMSQPGVPASLTQRESETFASLAGNAEAIIATERHWSTR